MKTVIFIVMGVILVFTSCQKEPMEPQNVQRTDVSSLPDMDNIEKQLRSGGDDDDEVFLIRGRIRNSSSAGIPDAEIDLLEYPSETSHSFTTSDGLGDYEIDSLALGVYIIEINAYGYELLRDTITLSDTLDIDYTLI